jgi:hypothetical protein
MSGEADRGHDWVSFGTMRMIPPDKLLTDEQIDALPRCPDCGWIRAYEDVPGVYGVRCTDPEDMKMGNALHRFLAEDAS